MKKRKERKFYTGFIILIRMIYESTAFAFSSLKTDKFRTFLSLLGVTIGIFSIVAVFSAVDALQKNINDGMSSFGSDMVFIRPWPMGPDEDGEFKWWEFRNRPNPSYDEYQFIKKNSTKSKHVAYIASFYKIIKYQRNSFTDGWCIAVSEDWDKIASFEVENGRFFSQMEMQNGSNACVVGAEVAAALFPYEDPVGKSIKIGNKETTVVGVCKKEGQSMVSMMDTDYLIMVPVTYAKSFINLKQNGDFIAATPIETVDQEEFTAELKTLTRAVRRLKPSQKDNFAINKMTFLFDVVGNVLGIVNVVGWVIGGFSLLIGAFGIANIMFVSVRERTNQIGIQKALGAKRYVILTQFLVEAAVLSLLGGALGILLVYLLSIGVRDLVPGFEIALSLSNILRGIIVSVAIGLVSGISPAYQASKLNPVEAINS